VRLIEVDESTLEDRLPASVTDIFNEPVDAIIGPASSLLAERLLPLAVRASVITCSPTASAMSLDDFPDPGPLFVRTIPSDELQARALARQLDGTGGRIVLAHVDDAYGQRFAAAVRAELSRGGSAITDIVAFDPADTDYTDDAAEIVASGAPTIGIIGDPEDGPRLVQALTAEIDPLVQTAVYMNDAMRVPTTSGVYRRLDPRMLEMMSGVSPRSTIADEEVASRFPADGQFFAANGYDCMNLLALAAREAGSISGAAMASQIVAVSSGGTSCATFLACAQASETGRNIDYDGPGGTLDIGRGGDPVSGRFDTYAFDPESGLDVTLAIAPIDVVSSG
jgi:branched-chain amino acid transport system substrate-binding protein